MDIKFDLEKDGVTFLKNVWEKNELTNLIKEYDDLDCNLTNTDIPKNEPIIVFWKHVLGEQKRICTFKEFPAMWTHINKNIVPIVRKILKGKVKKLQLLETIIFNKPFEKSNTLHWLEAVDEQAGALNYAIGSHKEGIKGSTSLHDRKPFDGEDRDLIPKDPSEAGYDVVCMEMDNTDIVCHNGYTWHYSGPNKKPNYTRKGVSVRFVIEDCVFDPRPGQGAAFTKQIELKKGDKFEGAPFPLL
jgi:hypothetical protein